MPHSPEGVANSFLERSIQTGTPSLTPMHLQKLVYIAHGWTLAINHAPLVDTQPQAWQYGPVYPSLYDNLKRFGSGVVPELIRENNWAGVVSYRGDIVREPFTAPEQAIVQRVYEQYADLSAFQLSALTHNADTPWTEAYVSGENRPISNDSIERYFTGVANAGRPAHA